MSDKTGDALHRMNGDLCDFGSRWRLDGDYLRCATCARPQIASCAELDFPHADWCVVAREVERHPWRSMLELLAPIATPPAQPSGSEGSVPDLQAMVLLLRTALAKAMDWNWLDDDARPSGTATFCDAAMRSVDAMLAAAPSPTKGDK